MGLYVAVMGRYQRKSTRQSWTEDDMRQAIDAVNQKRMGWLLASKTYHVPFTTLRRRAGSLQGSSKGYLGGHKVTFSKELETELVEHLQTMESRFFGLSTLDVRKLAFHIAEAKKIPHRFSRDKEVAGWDWLRAFTERNPAITLRTPESTSAARARSFNKIQIKNYFDRLSDILSEHSFQPADIWNVDESGLSTVPSKNVKIFATKGRKQVGVLSSAERGQHITVVCSMNAVGSFVPPAFIFPRKNMKNELMDHAPPGAIGLTQEKGWMNSEVFLKWLNHFVKFAKPTVENKVLLLVDGHSSHKSLEVITFAKENGVVLFCFPPHCTHRVQPLDVSFYSPLRTFYNQELTTWLKNHPGRTVTHFQVAEIFNPAYMKAATVKNATSGFSATGICPLNPNIFPEWMFSPADVTDIPNERVNQNQLDDEIISTQPGSSSNLDRNNNDNKSHETKNISVADLSPIPTTSQTRRTNRRKGKYGVLNSTPEIVLAKQLVAEKEAAFRRKSARAAKQIKKRITVDSDPSEEHIKDMQIETDDEEDAACIFCNELFSRSRTRETWLRCQVCNKWAHAECAGVSKSSKRFICDICCT